MVGAHPDIVLGIHQRRSGGELHLFYTLLSRVLGGGWTEERFKAQALVTSSPFSYLSSLFSDIERRRSRDDDDGSLAAERLLGVGAALAQDLAPGELLDRLAMLAAGPGDEEAPSLLVLSDECWVPWELLRLSRREGVEGLFMAEAFAMARWLLRVPVTRALPLTRIAVVAPQDSRLPHARVETEGLLGLASASRVVEVVSARKEDMLRELASGHFDGWHFATHVNARGANPDLWAVLLESGEQLDRFDLEGRARGLGDRRPLVYLSACDGARAANSLARVGGLARAFIEAGAGALLGTRWAIRDRSAADLARSFYSEFLCDVPIGEAMRRTRLRLRTANPGDATWLAFALFADPLARPRNLSEGAVVFHPGLVPPEARDDLEIPHHRWQEQSSPPGALLRADYGVVPFHGRERELDDLHAWCLEDRCVQVRLYTGIGGLGKTRLALELCQRMRDLGWVAGFVPLTAKGADKSPREAAERVASAGRPLLVVVDYAETRREFLAPFLATVLPGNDPVRVLLLARNSEDWWQQLKAGPDGVGDLLSAPAATSKRILDPLAVSAPERARTFRKATESFSRLLSRPVPAGLPKDLTARYFESVLLLHMSALAAVEGTQVEGETGILDWILTRESRYWSRQHEARGLPPYLEPGLGRMMAAVTLGGGVPSEAAAVAVLEELSFFAGQPRAILTAVARLLHDIYPGDAWIEPIQPDLLAEHLIDRELRDPEERDEIVRIVLGSASTPGPEPRRR